MARQICWTKKIVETFIEEACLTKDWQDILCTVVACLTISEQAEKFNISVCKVNRVIKRLKWEYDNIQKYCKDLPLRKVSAAELYMNTHYDDTFLVVYCYLFCIKV